MAGNNKNNNSMMRAIDNSINSLSNIKSKQILDNRLDAETCTLEYFLNQASTPAVISYINELSQSFNNMKGICLDISAKISANVYYEDSAYDFARFCSMYNSFIGFLRENAINSDYFYSISRDITYYIKDNKNFLYNLGITILENGFLRLKKINEDNLNRNTCVFLEDFYSKMCNFMQIPMTEYMKFKDFSCYFTYSCDYNTDSAYKLVDQGVLLDLEF